MEMETVQRLTCSPNSLERRPTLHQLHQADRGGASAARCAGKQIPSIVTGSLIHAIQDGTCIARTHAGPRSTRASNPCSCFCPLARRLSPTFHERRAASPNTDHPFSPILRYCLASALRRRHLHGTAPLPPWLGRRPGPPVASLQYGRKWCSYRFGCIAVDVRAGDGGRRHRRRRREG